MGNIYAQYAIFSVKDGSLIPELLKKYTTSDGYSYSVQLRGAQAIALGKETISKLVLHNQIISLYVSPFKDDFIGTDQFNPFQSLQRRLPDGWNSGGCGVAILDEYQNGLLYHSIMSKVAIVTGDKPFSSIEETGWCIFYTLKDANDFIANFIQNGFKKNVCIEARSVDPALFQWIYNTLGQNPALFTDIEHITELKAQDFSKTTSSFPEWLRPTPGDWSILGDLPHLEKLEFPHVCIWNFSFLLKCRQLKYLDLSATNFYEGSYLEYLENLRTLVLPPSEITDFSFLKKCRHLATLDVSRTNFADCSLLLELSELEVVILPSKRNLLHYEVIDSIPANVRTVEPETEDDVPPASYLSRKKLPLGENGFYAQAVVVDGRTYQGKLITKELLQKLVKNIKAGLTNSVIVSADLDMESIVFNAVIKDGWAVLALQDFENDVYYQPYNEKYSLTMEYAPPQVGGQSPVLKSEAVDDLIITADIVSHYIRFGKLSSKVRWVQAS